jgi:hypothetical protein
MTKLLKKGNRLFNVDESHPAMIPKVENRRDKIISINAEDGSSRLRLRYYIAQSV